MSEEMKDLENVLGTYRPAAPQVNRDSLMFAAGRAAGHAEMRRGIWRWRVAAGVMFLAAIGMGVWSAERIPSGTESAPIAHLLHPKTSSVRPEKAPILAKNEAFSLSIEEVPLGKVGGESSYLATRQRVLMLGMNGLPSLPEGEGQEKSSSPSLEIPDASPAWQRRGAGLFTGDHP
jgi:hypothetical protein